MRGDLLADFLVPVLICSELIRGPKTGGADHQEVLCEDQRDRWRASTGYCQLCCQQRGIEGKTGDWFLLVIQQVTDS